MPNCSKESKLKYNKKKSERTPRRPQQAIGYYLALQRVSSKTAQTKTFRRNSVKGVMHIDS